MEDSLPDKLPRPKTILPEASDTPKSSPKPLWSASTNPYPLYQLLPAEALPCCFVFTQNSTVKSDRLTGLATILLSTPLKYSPVVLAGVVPTTRGATTAAVEKVEVLLPAVAVAVILSPVIKLAKLASEKDHAPPEAVTVPKYTLPWFVPPVWGESLKISTTSDGPDVPVTMAIEALTTVGAVLLLFVPAPPKKIPPAELPYTWFPEILLLILSPPPFMETP